MLIQTMKRTTRSKTREAITDQLYASKTFDLETLIQLCEAHSSRSPSKKLRTGSQQTTKRTHKNNTTPKLSHDVFENLCLVLDELRELNSMIGMRKVKQTLTEHILYMAQGLYSDEDMHHIQITGEPGVGKTTLASLLGKMYAKLGYLENGDVIHVHRADMIGEHLGSTSVKTEAVLESCLGNVMLLDEVYAFGCHDKKDSFSKECLDCINQFLSEHRNEILCIIAGYQEDIRECIFSINRGLERRFPWKYCLEPYNASELRSVFIKQVEREKWTIQTDADTSCELGHIFHPTNVKLFNNNGGDTAILFMRCKTAHSVRLFVDRTGCKRKSINCKDLTQGFLNFMSYKQGLKAEEKYGMMYI